MGSPEAAPKLGQQGTEGYSGKQTGAPGLPEERARGHILLLAISPALHLECWDCDWMNTLLFL